jgi:diaminopimelate decarboxylase
VKPHYAIKSNPIAPILTQVRDNQLGFDCASKNEINTVLDLGVSAKDIVYSNSVKFEKDIHYAQQVGVEYTTADSIEEIQKIAQYGNKMKVLWRISIKEKDS